MAALAVLALVLAPWPCLANPYGKPAEKKPADKKSEAKKPAEKKPAEKKPAEKKSEAKKPADKKDTKKKPDKKSSKKSQPRKAEVRKKDRREHRRSEHRKAPEPSPKAEETCLSFAQGDEGPTVYFRALAQLPDLHAFPKDTRRWTVSALVKVGKDAVLVDGLSFRRKGDSWVWDGMKALSSGGATRIAALSEAGVVTDTCARSPDKWLVSLGGLVKRESWEELLLDSTWKRNPEAHSLVDQIRTDLKACGKERYLANLGRLPKFGLVSPALWFLLLKVETGSDKRADYVELGLVPVKDQFRLASLRVVCTD
jgi:hypothetical protein